MSYRFASFSLYKTVAVFSVGRDGVAARRCFIVSSCMLQFLSLNGYYKNNGFHSFLKVVPDIDVCVGFSYISRYTFLFDMPR